MSRASDNHDTIRAEITPRGMVKFYVPLAVLCAAAGGWGYSMETRVTDQGATMRGVDRTVMRMDQRLERIESMLMQGAPRR